MAEKRTIQKRDSHVRLIHSMMKKSYEIIGDKSLSQNPKNELASLSKNVKTKKGIIDELNLEVADFIKDEEIDKHLEDENNLNIEVDIVIEAIEDNDILNK